MRIEIDTLPGKALHLNKFPPKDRAGTQKVSHSNNVCCHIGTRRSLFCFSLSHIQVEVRPPSGRGRDSPAHRQVPPVSNAHLQNPLELPPLFHALPASSLCRVITWRDGRRASFKPTDQTARQFGRGSVLPATDRPAAQNGHWSVPPLLPSCPKACLHTL